MLLLNYLIIYYYAVYLNGICIAVNKEGIVYFLVETWR